MTITPKRKTNMPEFTDTFIRAGLTKGWLTPPRDDYRPHVSEDVLNCVVWIGIAVGAIGLVAWMFVR